LCLSADINKQKWWWWWWKCAVYSQIHHHHTVWKYCLCFKCADLWKIYGFDQ